MAEPLVQTPDDVASYLDYIRRLSMPGGAMAQGQLAFQAGGFPSPQPPPEQIPPTATPTQQKQLPPQSTGNYGPPPVYSAPPQPQFMNAPSAQPPMEGNPFEVFKNPLVGLAIIGSLFTRRPLVNAMTAASGAMNGYTKQQDDVFQQNKERFHEQLEQAAEQNRTELARYNAAWDRKKIDNWNEALPKLWAEAGANKDEFMMQMLRLGPEYAEKAMMMREQAQNSIYKATEVENARQLAREQEVDRLKQDPGVIAQAKAIRNYDQPPLPQGRNNPRNQAIQELVTEGSEAAGEPYQTAGYGAKNKFVTGLGSTTTGSPGGQVNSAKIVIRHLATLDQLIDDLGTDSNTATFRRAAQRIQTEFGLSSAPTNFDAAVSLVSGEIVKLVEGAGGTGEDRQHVRSAFDRANSGPLLHDAVDVAREVMSARVDTLAEQAKASHAGSEFSRYLPPDIQGLLKPRRARGGSVDVEDFRRKAKEAGHSDAEIDKFLADKGH